MSTVPSPPPSRVRAAAAVAAVALLGLVASACGDDTDAAGADGTTPTTAAQPAQPTEAHDEHVAHVTMVDFDFEDLPARVPAGTTLTVENASASELHEIVAFRLPDDETRSVDEIMALPQAELGAILGAAPPATVLLAAPGGPQIDAVGDGTLTEPGRYLVLCSIPTGVEPGVYLEAAAASNGEPPQVEGGPPHFVAGMYAELVVE